MIEIAAVIEFTCRGCGGTVPEQRGADRCGRCWCVQHGRPKVRAGVGERICMACEEGP